MVCTADNKLEFSVPTRFNSPTPTNPFQEHMGRHVQAYDRALIKKLDEIAVSIMPRLEVTVSAMRM